MKPFRHVTPSALEKIYRIAKEQKSKLKDAPETEMWNLMQNKNISKFSRILRNWEFREATACFDRNELPQIRANQKENGNFVMLFKW